MALEDWVVGIVGRFGALGVGLLVALEMVVPPIPSEIVLPLAGFASTRGAVGFWGAVLAATAGATVGSLALYYVARGMGERRLRAFVGRHGRWVLVGEDDVERSMAWFDRHGASAVLFGRVVPGIRSYVSIPAGLVRMPLPRFLAMTALGSGAWSLLLVWLGTVLGAQWHLVEPWVSRVGWTVWVLLAGLLAWGIVKRARKRQHDRRGGPSA